jgi:hypothetical protein
MSRPIFAIMKIGSSLREAETLTLNAEDAAPTLARRHIFVGGEFDR